MKKLKGFATWWFCKSALAVTSVFLLCGNPNEARAQQGDEFIQAINTVSLGVQLSGITHFGMSRAQGLLMDAHTLFQSGSLVPAARSAMAAGGLVMFSAGETIAEAGPLASVAKSLMTPARGLISAAQGLVAVEAGATTTGGATVAIGVGATAFIGFTVVAGAVAVVVYTEHENAFLGYDIDGNEIYTWNYVPKTQADYEVTEREWARRHPEDYARWLLQKQRPTSETPPQIIGGLQYIGGTRQ